MSRLDPGPDHERSTELEVLGPSGRPASSRPRTDPGNAERLVHRFWDELRYCRQQRRWRYWDKHRWAPDLTGEAERRAKATVRAIYNEARRAADSDERRALARWAVTSEDRHRIAASRPRTDRARAGGGPLGPGP